MVCDPRWDVWFPPPVCSPISESHSLGCKWDCLLLSHVNALMNSPKWDAWWLHLTLGVFFGQQLICVSSNFTKLFFCQCLHIKSFTVPKNTLKWLVYCFYKLKTKIIKSCFMGSIINWGLLTRWTMCCNLVITSN